MDGPKTIVTDGRTDTTLKGSGLGVKPNGFPQELEAQRARTWGKHKTGRCYLATKAISLRHSSLS